MYIFFYKVECLVTDNFIDFPGGDYAYIYHILGPMPGFLCAWIQISIVACCSNGVVARTAGLYVGTPVFLDCYNLFITLIAVFIIGKS